MIMKTTINYKIYRNNTSNEYYAVSFSFLSVVLYIIYKSIIVRLYGLMKSNSYKLILLKPKTQNVNYLINTDCISGKYKNIICISNLGLTWLGESRCIVLILIYKTGSVYMFERSNLKNH